MNYQDTLLAESSWFISRVSRVHILLICIVMKVGHLSKSVSTAISSSEAMVAIPQKKKKSTSLWRVMWPFSWPPGHMMSKCEQSKCTVFFVRRAVSIQCRGTRTFQRWILVLEIFELISLLQHVVHIGTVKRRTCELLEGWEKVKLCSPVKVTV